MADIRINALATTATTPASDDYLALDGTAQGTRKILATNIANNVTDVILGTSGPSVKSTLSARAPRQGLVFDGTAQGSTATSITALGTTYSVAFWINPDNVSGTKVILNNGTRSVVYLDNAAITTPGGVATGISLTAGKMALVVLSNTAGTMTPYLNGVALSNITQSVSIEAGTYTIGGSGTAYMAGFLSPLIYNRALSASEVVSLYEAGAPAGADYNSASNTAINSSAFTNFNYDTFSGASATGFTAVNTSGATEYAQGNPVSITGLKYGNVIRVTYSLTLNSGQLPQVALGNIGTETHSAFYSLTAGSNQTVDIVVNTNSGTSTNIAFRSTAASNYAISSVSAQRIGLLLAPDAAQAGGGLTWYDTSGNAANISWTSGVSWNVPSSRVLGGNWTTSGNLTVSGTGTNYFVGDITSTATGNNQWQITKGAATNYATLVFSESTSGATWAIGQRTTAAAGGANRLSFYGSGIGGDAMQITYLGNLLIGTNVDSSALLQVGTNTSTAAGGMKFGTDTSLYRSQTGMLALDGLTGSLSQLDLRVGGVQKAFVAWNGGDFYLGAVVGTTVIRSSNTTALTLDSSQNATFAGTARINGGVAYLASNSDIDLQFTKANLDKRWRFVVTGTESGSNAGSNMNFYTYSDAGAFLGTPLSINRSTGDATFAGNAAISGSLLAGKTTTNLATVGFRVDTDGAAYASLNSSVDNTTAYNVYSTSAAAYRFYVGLGGTVFATNTTISAISDVRLKENIRDLSGGLSSILALKPRVFDWKEGKGANKKNVRGFIAQEIEQVFPDLVDEWKDPAPDGESPYKSVRQDLIPVLVKAIQELTARVVALENA